MSALTVDLEAKIKTKTIKYIDSLEQSGVTVSRLADILQIERASIYKWKQHPNPNPNIKGSTIPTKTAFVRLSGIYHSPLTARELIMAAIRHVYTQETQGSLYELMVADNLLQSNGDWNPMLGAILGGALGEIFGGIISSFLGVAFSGGSSKSITGLDLSTNSIAILKIDPTIPWPEIIELIDVIEPSPEKNDPESILRKAFREAYESSKKS
ncbi:MAG: hypothetical protein H7235_07245 [Bdellovibrionaceae bacterium]|nr:hypothetical protein [Pseudobdellovibrionaceae bacterium]